MTTRLYAIAQRNLAQARKDYVAIEALADHPEKASRLVRMEQIIDQFAAEVAAFDAKSSHLSEARS